MESTFYNAETSLGKNDDVILMTETNEDVLMIEQFLNENYLVRRNVLTDTVEYKKREESDDDFRPFTEESLNSVVIRARKEDVADNPRQIIKEIVFSEETPDYNPIRDYLNSLSPWDGKDRVVPLLSRIPGISAEQIYLASIWLRSVVAHWLGMDTDYGNQVVLTLIGKQGCGKSHFCKMLLPKHLQKYYLDHINIANKFDKEMALTNNLLVNLDELDSIRPSQQAELKQVITKANVNARPIYGRTQKLRERYASFVATTNNRQPLQDATGSRRYLCITIEDGLYIDKTDLSKEEYEQLMAQILHELREENARYWFSNDETERIQRLNLCHCSVSTLEEMIDACFRKPENEKEGQLLTSTELLEVLETTFPKMSKDRPSKIRLGIMLKNKGFEVRKNNKGHLYNVVQKIA